MTRGAYTYYSYSAPFSRTGSVLYEREQTARCNAGPYVFLP